MVYCDDDYAAVQSKLDRISDTGEKMGMLTKLLGKNAAKILWTVLALTVGGVLCFLWAYFKGLKSGRRS